MVASLHYGEGWGEIGFEKTTDPGRLPVKNILSKFKYATKTHFSCMLFCPDSYREC